LGKKGALGKRMRLRGAKDQFGTVRCKTARGEEGKLMISICLPIENYLKNIALYLDLIEKSQILFKTDYV